VDIRLDELHAILQLSCCPQLEARIYISVSFAKNGKASGRSRASNRLSRAGLTALLHRQDNGKVLPFPGSLSTVISPHGLYDRFGDAESKAVPSALRTDSAL